MNTHPDEIKPRRFELNLSGEDMRKLFILAYGSGLTPEQLLEGFACDLIGGTAANGSDEQQLARDYFNALLKPRLYLYTEQPDIITYSLKNYSIDFFLSAIEEYNNGKPEAFNDIIKDYEEETDNPQEVNEETLNRIRSLARACWKHNI